LIPIGLPMAKDDLSGKLAVILHADVAGSTQLVQQDEQLAHERIRDAFRRFSDTIEKYHGRVQELRGDALLAEFDRASDAVTAALSFQSDHHDQLANLNDNIRPDIRVGIALGEVVIADNTVTGAGVVLAQRVEQLAQPGGLCITSAINEALPSRMPFSIESLGEQALKGFEEHVRVYQVQLGSGESVPPPQQKSNRQVSPKNWPRMAVVVVVVLLVAAGIGYWSKGFLPQEQPVLVESKAFPLPDKPSIAVLAFDNLSGDPGQEYLSDGISETIITGLSQFPELFVIARQSSFSYKGRAVKAQEIASDLGVQYIIEGSVQKSDSRVRVTAQLIDALSGHHLWAQQYNRQWEDIFALQDDITQHIIANIGSFEGPLEEAIRNQIKQKAPSDLRAYDYLLLGRERFLLVTKEENIKARELFQKSIELDPNYGRGHTWLAWTHFSDLVFGWTDDPEKSGKLALEYAQSAVSLDNTDAEAHWVLGAVLIHTGQGDKEALAAYERALALNPNNADLLAEYGWNIPNLGRAEEAVKSIRKAMRLNPVYPDWYGQALMFALYNARRYEEVVAVSKTINVRHVVTHVVLAGSYAYMDQLDKAHLSAAHVLENNPNFTLGWWRERQNFSHQVTLDHYMDGLSKAGLPE
jgi:adenylate cyclase